jgi:MinD-like ATPase involved in chromosome partitioning or flagellar assembly
MKMSGYFTAKIQAFHLDSQGNLVTAKGVVGIRNEPTEVNQHGPGRVDHPARRWAHRDRPVLEHVFNSALLRRECGSGWPTQYRRLGWPGLTSRRPRNLCSVSDGHDFRARQAPPTDEPVGGPNGAGPAQGPPPQPPGDTPPYPWTASPARTHPVHTSQHLRPPGPAPGPPRSPWHQPALPSQQNTGRGSDTRGFATPPQRQEVAPPPTAPAPSDPGQTSWTYSELVPRKATPGRGWRRVLFNTTFGLVNFGPSPDEVQLAQTEAKIRTHLRGYYKIGVLGKGGVGKTSVAVSVGSLLAELRPQDRVVAIDADTAFGKLGARVDPGAQGSYWELNTDQHLHAFADIRSRLGNNEAGLFVLAGESNPAGRRRVLDPAVFREAASRLQRHFSIVIVDCGSTLDSPVTQEAIRDLDSLIVVSSPWIDGASAAGQTMDWLADRGMTPLLHRTILVLNDSDGHADKRTRASLVEQFALSGQVAVEVPFDPHVRPGGVIDVQHQMAPATRRRFLDIAAAIAQHFSQSPASRST